MRNVILLTGAAIAVTASPAMAGGPLGGGMLSSIMSTTRTSSSTSTSSLTRTFTTSSNRSHHSTSGSAANCLCQTVSGLTGHAPSIGRTGNASLIVNSVVGLGAVSRGHGHGGGQSFGLAGTVTGTANNAASLSRYGHGVGLAGTVTGTVNSALVGRVSHGTGNGISRNPVLNVSALNARAGQAGRVANVPVLNGRAANGRSLANVTALNGTGGTAGRIVNVSALNGTRTIGQSAVNVTALNRAGTSGRIANVSILNKTRTRGRSLANAAILNGSGPSAHRFHRLPFQFPLQSHGPVHSQQRRDPRNADDRQSDPVKEHSIDQTNFSFDPDSRWPGGR